jgi:hypothetical protein
MAFKKAFLVTLYSQADEEAQVKPAVERRQMIRICRIKNSKSVRVL